MSQEASVQFLEEPMEEADVAVAVNPDRELRRRALAAGWKIMDL